MNKKILEHFKINDPVLYRVMIKTGIESKSDKVDSNIFFIELCEIIVGQQLSNKAADTIFKRFKKIYKDSITPIKVFKTPHDQLRAAGLSNSKSKYIKNLAEAVIEKKLVLENLIELRDDEVKKQLIQIKGIGPWTAEMFLMFTLNRPDVFSHGDLGLRKAIKNIYGFKKEPSVKTIEKIIRKWSPYKTYASMTLWKYLDF